MAENEKQKKQPQAGAKDSPTGRPEAPREAGADVQQKRPPDAFVVASPAEYERRMAALRVVMLAQRAKLQEQLKTGPKFMKTVFSK
ncbi:MAG: hypothetical protein KDB73_09710 [Planctomycetes bacterium]|nr:hypothetical protein [Planctomycetota bacterium]